MRLFCCHNQFYHCNPLQESIPSVNGDDETIPHPVQQPIPGADDPTVQPGAPATTTGCDDVTIQPAAMTETSSAQPHTTTMEQFGNASIASRGATIVVAADDTTADAAAAYAITLV